MLSFLSLFVYVRSVLFMRVISFCKRNKKDWNCPNNLIYITTYIPSSENFAEIIIKMRKIGKGPRFVIDIFSFFIYIF